MAYSSTHPMLLCDLMCEGRPAFPPKWQDPHTGAEPLRNEPLAGILVEVEWRRHNLSPGDRGRGRPAPTPGPSQWAASPLAIRLREALALNPNESLDPAALRMTPRK